MRRYFLTSIFLLLLFIISSCEKVAIHHSGEMVLDNTTVRYLVEEKITAEGSGPTSTFFALTITAEGSVPTSTIYVKLMSVQSATMNETVIDSIVTIPHEKSVYLWKDSEYSLFLEKDGKTIGIGQFNF